MDKNPAVWNQKAVSLAAINARFRLFHFNANEVGNIRPIEFQFSDKDKYLCLPDGTVQKKGDAVVTSKDEEMFVDANDEWGVKPFV